MNLDDAYWENTENRRRFLTAFAIEMGFDPLIAKHWTGTHVSLRAHGVSDVCALLFVFILEIHLLLLVQASKLLDRYKSLWQMLCDTFPDLQTIPASGVRYMFLFSFSSIDV